MYKLLQVISNIMLLKHLYHYKELINRAVLKFSKYCICWYVVLIMYSNCLEWNLSKEQMVINLSVVLLVKVHLCLLLCIVILRTNDYIHDIIFATLGF